MKEFASALNMIANARAADSIQCSDFSGSKKAISNLIELVRDKEFPGFRIPLLVEGIGPKAIHLLALASNAMYGTALQFTDPARFTFAHGGKNDPSSLVSAKEHEETIRSMELLLQKANIENADKQVAFENLNQIKHHLEHGFEGIQINSEQRKGSVDRIKATWLVSELLVYFFLLQVL